MAKSPKKLDKEIKEVTSLSEVKKILDKGHDLSTKLFNEWNKGTKRNIDSLLKNLEVSKILLTKMQFLPMKQPVSEKELSIARDILEIGALTNVARADETGVKEFEKYVAQLKHYYFDFRGYFKKPSERMLEILSINLLRLLGEDLIVEFHSELELIVQSTNQDMQSVFENNFVKVAIRVQQSLMDGTFNRIYELLKEEMPSPWFAFFISRVLKSTTQSRAKIVEKAYERMSIDGLAKILDIYDSKELDKLCFLHNWKKLNDGFVYFQYQVKDTEKLQSMEMTMDCLDYAKNLDTII